MFLKWRGKKLNTQKEINSYKLVNLYTI